jgi:hypothetical protein
MVYAPLQHTGVHMQNYLDLSSTHWDGSALEFLFIITIVISRRNQRSKPDVEVLMGTFYCAQYHMGENRSNDLFSDAKVWEGLRYASSPVVVLFPYFEPTTCYIRIQTYDTIWHSFTERE